MNRVDVTLSTSSDVVDVMADVDFELQGGVSDIEGDLVDVINDVVFARCVNAAKLRTGSYNIRMLCVITRNNEDEHVAVEDSDIPRNVAHSNLSGPGEVDRGGRETLPSSLLC